MDTHETTPPSQPTSAGPITAAPNAASPIDAPLVAPPEPTYLRAPAEPTQFTHESKLPPVQLERAKPRLIAKAPTILAIGGLGAALAISVALAFSPQQTPSPQPGPPEQTTTGPRAVQLPDVIQEPPATAGPKATSAGPGHPQDSQGFRQPPPPPALSSSELSPAEVQRRALADEEEKARTSPLYANIEDPFASDSRTPPADPPSLNPASVQRLAAASGSSKTSPAATESGLADPNLQQRKTAFLAQTADDGQLGHELQAPRSPYELKAGTIIPTVLVTGIDSDLPGKILGQVRENVYDTVSGNYLLIPQGSKLLATYDSMVAYGQERVLVCWNRIIRPDGSSLSLDCMPGVDLSGYSGFADSVDHHWWRVLSGVALGSVLGAGVQFSQGNVAGFVPTLGQAMASNAAGAVNQAGQQITNKALNIQPTIRIRPGFAVNVFVTKDLVLTPYAPNPGGRQ